MQVSDLYFRLKLITFGFLSPVFIFLGFLFASPFLLKVDVPYHKSELAILETDPLPSKKFLKSISALYQKQVFKRIIIVSREDKLDLRLTSAKESEAKIKDYLSSLNVNAENIDILNIAQTKLGDTDETAKNILKVVVADNLKSILILCREYESKRMLKIYQKNLASLPVQISAYPFASEQTPSTWFLSEDGFREVSSEFLRYIYYLIRGI
jgi:hypothetical protein